MLGVRTRCLPSGLTGPVRRPHGTGCKGRAKGSTRSTGSGRPDRPGVPGSDRVGSRAYFRMLLLQTWLSTYFPSVVGFTRFACAWSSIT